MNPIETHQLLFNLGKLLDKPTEWTHIEATSYLTKHLLDAGKTKQVYGMLAGLCDDPRVKQACKDLSNL